jgi:hypothetical protein
MIEISLDYLLTIPLDDPLWNVLDKLKTIDDAGKVGHYNAKNRAIQLTGFDEKDELAFKLKFGDSIGF